VLRLLLRAPIWLYRLQLGWLFGHRLLLLTHRGRKSGKVRQAVLEVVRFDPASQESIVMAGWRGDVDWYRNLQAHPALGVSTGRNHYVPAQRFLTAEETVTELQRYVRRYPVAAGWVLPGLFGFALARDEVEWRDAATFFHGVAFRPQTAADDA
jgi:deazaflavin-dependent oxidoreductase (nitroreductase family)